MIPKVLVNSEAPYPGLDAYNEEHSDFFFGRDDEIATLVSLITTNKIVVLYGKSGIGKTSLLAAGVLPLLRKDNYLPVYMTLRFDQPDVSPMLQLKKNIEKAFRLHGYNQSIQDLTLWEFFSTTVTREDIPTPILILDSFELFFQGSQANSKQKNELISELADLAEPRIPSAIIKKYSNSPVPYPAESPRCKVLISVREDYLVHLESITSFIPSLTDNLVRINQLSHNNVVNYIRKAGGQLLNNDIAEQIADLIFMKSIPENHYTDKLDELKQSSLYEPFLVSYICQQINELRKQSFAAKITDEVLKKVNIGRIIKSLYYNNTYDLSPKHRNLIENELITLDGYRKLTSRKEITNQKGLPEEIIEKLIERRILRNEYWNESEHIEISHELLIPIIKQSRDKRIKEENKRKREEELKEIKREEEKKRLEERQKLQEEAEKERQKSRLRIKKLKAYFLIISVSSLVVIGLLSFGLIQKRRATKSEKEARASYIAAQGLLKLDEDPTLCFRLCELADSISPGSIMAEMGLREAFSQRAFYQIWATSIEPFVRVKYSPDGQTVLAVTNTTVELRTATGGTLRKFEAHRQPVAHAAFSNSGTYIITTSADKTAKIFTLQGKEVLTLAGHERPVTYAEFSPDDQYIVTTSPDNSARIWQTSDGKLLHIIKSKNDIQTASFSPDSKQIITAEKNWNVTVWNTNGQQMLSIPHESSVQVARYTKDGQHIVTACEDGSVRMFTTDGVIKNQLAPFGKAVNSIEFDATGQYMLLGSDDKKICVYDLNTLKTKLFTGHSGPVNNAVFSPDGKYILSCSTDNTIRIWRFTGIEAGILASFDRTARYAEYTAVKNMIAVATGNECQLFDAKRNYLRTLKGHTGIVHTARFAPNAETILTTSSDSTAILWSLNGKILTTFRHHKDQVFQGTFSPDGQKIITVSRDGSAILCDLRGRILQLFHDDKDEECNYAAFAPDGNRIVICSDNQARIWNTDGTRFRSLNHAHTVYSAEYSPDGKRIITTSLDKIARVWSSEGELLYTLAGHEDYVNMGTFSSDNKYILTSSNDKTVKLWNNEGKELFTLREHDGNVYSALFAQENTYIITASNDRTVRLFPISIKSILDIVNISEDYGKVWRLDGESRKKHL